MALVLAAVGTARAADLPAQVLRQLPRGYDVLSAEAAAFGHPARGFYIVALGRPDEATRRVGTPPRAPARPLLLFQRQSDGSFRLAGRNDGVILRANEGGQCDPFLDGNATIAVHGPYFTIQNGVACGQHWTDYVTFRFDGAVGGYVFDNERNESWSLNPSSDPDADALVRDGPQDVRTGSRKRPVRFQNWRRSM